MFYEGTDVQKDNYKTIVRIENSWISASDSEVWKVDKQPRNSKDFFLLLYKNLRLMLMLH